jgi:hypothetical protein
VPEAEAEFQRVLTATLKHAAATLGMAKGVLQPQRVPKALEWFERVVADHHTPEATRRHVHQGTPQRLTIGRGRREAAPRRRMRVVRPRVDRGSSGAGKRRRRRNRAGDLWAGWPQNYCGEGHVIGSTAGIWAESPDRVYIFNRGCLPVVKDAPAPPTPSSRPATPRATTFAEGSGPASALGSRVQRGRATAGSSSRGSAQQAVRASAHASSSTPYDADRHVWLVDDGAHAIYSSRATARRS